MERTPTVCGRDGGEWGNQGEKAKNLTEITWKTHRLSLKRSKWRRNSWNTYVNLGRGLAVDISINKILNLCTSFFLFCMLWFKVYYHIHEISKALQMAGFLSMYSNQEICSLNSVVRLTSSKTFHNIMLFSNFKSECSFGIYTP